MTTTTNTKPASELQRNYLTSLLATKDLTGTAYPAWDAGVVANVTSREASAAIDDLLKLRRNPAAPRPAAKTPAAPKVEITQGMYLVGADIESGRVFRVVPSQSSGHLYAKELIEGEPVDGERRGTFEYAQGAMGIIARQGRRMTVEEASAFGHLFSFCCCCGRELSNPESVALGIGPICRSKWF